MEPSAAWWAAHEVATATPITADSFERALDVMARFMIEYRKDGRIHLPLFERLERELEPVRAVDDAMAQVRARADRKSAKWA